MLTGQGPLQGHPLWCWPRALWSLGGEDSPVLVSDLPSAAGEQHQTSAPLLDATFLCENTGWSPPHPAAIPGPCPAGSSYLHSFSVILEGSVHL